MVIKGIVVENLCGKFRLSGFIGNEELWFECESEHQLYASMDAYLSAALVPAMYVGEDISIESDLAVSEKLYRNIEKIQNILTLWFPELSKIKINGANLYKDSNSYTSGVASFFSGGVDGSYTFLNNIEHITHAVFVEGIDIQLDNEVGLEEAKSRNIEYVEGKDKQIIIIRSNIREFITGKGFTWNIANAAGLSAVAHALKFRKTLVAGTNSALGLFSWGSHPILDYLFSSESVEIIHDAVEVRRTDKIKKIAADADAFKILRVCWHDGSYNCGKCEKCLRTMITMRLLGIKASTFPAIDLMQAIKSLRFYDEAQYLFFEENLALAKEVDDKEMVRALSVLEKQHAVRAALISLDDAWLGGRLKKGFRGIFSR